MPVRAAATRTARSAHATQATTVTRSTRATRPAATVTAVSSPTTTSATTSATTTTVRPARRRGRGRAEIVHQPLGSLTQRDDRVHAWCQACGSAHITRLSMHLTDGTPVDFTSCHRCEHRTWEHADGPLTVDGVLDRTRKPE